jgi:dethiobiotin synthetase
MQSYFITGNGTDVGKTVVSAILTEAWQADYWKPIQSGALEGSDRNTIGALISNSKTVIHPENYIFQAVASPHLAAQAENQQIDFDNLALPKTSNNLIIEGAGGLLVPLNQKYYAIDLARKFSLPVILVCRYYLGAINHTLLSIDYLLRNNFKIHGLVLNGDTNQDLEHAIMNFIPLPILLRLPISQIVDRKFISTQAAKIYDSK